MFPYPSFEGYSRKLMTLTIILKNDMILLGMKNRGMGIGKWNGFGGKVEHNETIDDAAKREVKEECGLDVISMDKIGIIEFEYVGSEELLEGHIYLCYLFRGDIIESDEMAPIKWFKIEDAPCDTMWIDHKFWFPMILKRIPFKAHFKYLNDDTMLDSTIMLLHSAKKTRETWVNVILKKENLIFFCRNNEETKYFNKHEQIKKEESVENAAIRYLKCYYNIIAEECVQKVAVVDVEILDKQCIKEIHFFVVDIADLKIKPQFQNSQWLDINKMLRNNLWPDKKFMSTILNMKSFNAYFLIDKNCILCSKYNFNN